MKIIKKIIGVDGFHKSRFHDEKGNKIDLKGFKYLPHCILTTFLRISIGLRPSLPWIGYRAIRRIKRILKPGTKMVEFGSGMSTIWYSKLCTQVISIEDNERWYSKIAEKLKRLNVMNVEYKYKTALQYHQLDEFDDGFFDFIMIDGSERTKCVLSAIKKVKSNGFIYLDNSDKFANDPIGDIRVAESILLKAVKEKKGTVEYYVDLVPTYLHVTQGMLVQL